MLNDNTSPETRKKLAEANDTPAEILEELSHNSDRTIRTLVASNPNTSTEVLLQLGVEFPNEVTANPIFSLLMLENPDSNFIQLSLARSSTTAIEILRTLAADSNYIVRQAVAGNASTPASILEILAVDSDYSRDYIVRQVVAVNANTPAYTLIKLAADSNYIVRAAVASNVSTPVDILEKLAADIESNVRQEVAQNPHTTVEVLQSLRSDKCVAVAEAAQKRLAEQ